MNKQNKILLGVLALIVACTVGYALFSESITISGTASASGNFDIEATCLTTISQDIKEHLGMSTENSKEGGYSDVVCTASINSATLGATLNYPGATKYIAVKFENKSNMTATISGDGFTETSLLKVYNNNTNALLETLEDSDSNVYTSWGDSLYFEKTNHTLVYEDNFVSEGFFDEENERYLLKPGESMYWVYKLKWDSHTNNKQLTQEDFKTKYIANEITATYNFTQAQ